MQETESLPDATGRASFPLWLKLAYTAFMCVLVPFYWDTWMAPGIYFGLMMVLFPLVLFWPIHLLLKRLAPPVPPPS